MLLGHLNFCPDFLGHTKKSLIRKLKKVKVNFKMYNVINWVIDNCKLKLILPEKGNQTMIFVSQQNIKMKNIFLEKSFKN